MATQAKKSTKAKAEKAPKRPKAEKVLGYFRADSTVGAISKMVADEKIHRIESILASAQKEQNVDADAAEFAFKVLFTNKYPGNKVGKIQYKGLGHATVNFAGGTIQFHKGSGKTEIIPAAKDEKKATPRSKPKSKVKADSKEDGRQPKQAPIPAMGAQPQTSETVN